MDDAKKVEFETLAGLRGGGKFLKSVELLREALNEHQTVMVLCHDPERERRKYEGHGLDIDRIQFVAPRKEDLDDRRSRGDWLLRIKKAVR